ncbi:glycosyltransferase family A protein [Flavobacterium sp. LHD-80]|uniref:glycosyltransferase family 2 protein n=1 Tax=Flavobacterium sp. LHD-80 TaxID=3071411 RepID=UPI0027DFA843|nr:glycosyltransferase family A protein [Flavobacterium sp. LHD-80]MDQ6472083.1 glycosyltransferase family A protein [Flavobacterium sp. LHD-80]
MLAIVIPYYKINFFEATLQSLANQTSKQFKVYIGDDASPNDPKKIIEKYKNEFDFIYQRFEQNLGGKSLVQQWNRCLNLCNEEEWVMILGDDDVLESNCVDSFYNNLSEIQYTDTSVVRFSTQVIDENGLPISKVHQHPKAEKAADFLIRKFKGGTRSSLSEYIFKKELVESIQFKDFPLAWHSDLLAVLEFSKWRQIFTINDALVYFRLSGLNITSKKDDDVIKNCATFQFYYYLLYNYSTQFSSSEINLLFDNIEKTLLNNKRNTKHWLQLFLLYFKFFRYKRFLVLSLKIKKSIV